MDFFTSNYNYDIIIVGGGISGLFSAYKLSPTYLKILLIESSDILGGRIETFSKNNIKYDCGASHFHKSHGKLLSLLSELKLEKEILPVSKDITTILRNKSDNYEYNTKQKLNVFDLLNITPKDKHQLPDKILSQITFYQYLILLFDQETATFIKDSLGNDSIFNYLNADSALKMFEDDFFKDNNYYTLKNGLSEIIIRLESLLNNYDNVTIKKNCSLSEIDSINKTIKSNSGDKFTYDNLILTIPTNKLKEINYFKNNTLLDSVKSVKVHRIFAKYPTDNLWFKNIKKTITDNYLRNIIPIDYEKGIIMLSYTDNLNAEMWNSYGTIGQKFLIKALHKEIQTLFGISPPDPIFISSHYWENGTHLWKTGSNMEKIYSQIIKPDLTKDIYIVGESFSKKQGWIEGTLETVYDLLKIINIKGFEFVSSKN